MLITYPDTGIALTLSLAALKVWFALRELSTLSGTSALTIASQRALGRASNLSPQSAYRGLSELQRVNLVAVRKDGGAMVVTL